MPDSIAKTHTLRIDSTTLPVPERSFYANVVRTTERAEFVTFAFGQLYPFGSSVHAEVAFDISKKALAVIVGTFKPGFREALKPAQLPEFSHGEVANTLTYPATLTRILLNDFIAVIDFFDLEPMVDSSGTINPAVRIKATPSVLSFFVEHCDKYAGVTK